MKKLKNQKGETLIEALLSILIAAICIGLLVTSVTAAGRMNAAVKKDLTKELHFAYSDASRGTGNVMVTMEGDSPVRIDVIKYKSNDYLFYKQKLI